MEKPFLNLNGHSLFSPSSSEMWLTCPASLMANAEERLKGDSSSVFAAEGTVAHELAEVWLTSGKKPIHLLGEIKMESGFDIEIDDEMLSYVGDYVNWCNDQGGDKYVEVKVDFSHLVPVDKQTGTSDHVCCKTGKLTITDLKYGMGVKVYAEDNTQMMLYALGAMKEFDWLYDFKEVEMRICQPRLSHFDSWVLPVDELIKFGEKVKVLSAKTLEPNPPRITSETGCTWCKVKAKCPAKAAEIEAIVDEAFAEDDVEGVIERIDNDEFASRIPDVKNLTIEQQEKILSKSKNIRTFLDEIEKKLFDFAQKGGKLSSYKLVAGRKTRSWSDETAVKEYFSKLGLSDDDFQPRTLLSPAGAEKLLKKQGLSQDVSDLVADRTGKPTLVPISDKRPEYVPDDGVWSD